MLGNWLLILHLDSELKLSSEEEEDNVVNQEDEEKGMFPQAPEFFHSNLSIIRLIRAIKLSIRQPDI